MDLHHKDMSLKVILLLFLTFSYTNGSSHDGFRTTYFYEEKNFQDRYNSSLAFNATILLSEIQCGASCTRHENCTSFFYNRVTTMCSLANGRLNETYDTIYEPGWTYYLERASTCPDDYEILPNTGVCLKYHDATTSARPYNEMQILCQNEGGQLLRVENNDQRLEVASYLTNRVGSSSLTQVVIQGVEQRPSGIWYFDDGTVITYLPWASNPQQPNTATDNCLYLKTPFEYWWDGGCTIMAGFLCQVQT